MGKDYLREGNLHDNTMSSIRFNDNNNFDLDLHFGCSIMVYEKSGNEMAELMEFFMAMNTDKDDPDWVQAGSFVMSMQSNF